MSAERPEVGTCALCGQYMLRTADDCWHPHTVPEACPPGDPMSNPAAFTGYDVSTGRPGRQHFRPGDDR